MATIKSTAAKAISIRCASSAPKKELSTAERRKRAMAVLAGTPYGGLIEAFAHIPVRKIKVWSIVAKDYAIHPVHPDIVSRFALRKGPYSEAITIRWSL